MGKKIDPAEYLRIGTAAGIAGVTRAYLHRLIREGRMPHVEIDGQWFLHRQDAEEFAARAPHPNSPKKP